MVSVFAQDIIGILTAITQMLDFFAVTIIAVSVIQAIISRVTTEFNFHFSYNSNILTNKNQNNKDLKDESSQRNMWIRDLINGLLLALEFESASAIIKLGIFTTRITNSESITNNLEEFIFIVSILFLRIVLNQSLRRFNIAR
jgi:hypothetical protein